MANKRLKKVLGMSIAVPLLLSAATACSSNSNDNSGGQNGASASSSASNGASASSSAKGGDKPEQVTLSFLSNWNGGGGSFPQDQVNNPVAQRVKEVTGVTLKMESITTNETEKLNTIFASGTVPDMVNAPFWSTTSGEGQVIKKAALEGQLLDLTPYLDKYPNVKKLMTTGVAKDFSEFEMNSPDFQGKNYVIPMQTPDGSVESIHNWNYGLYARGDILKALNVNPEDIDTEDKLYDLLVKIKNGNFKDISGKPVIPAGTMHDGWDYGQFLKGWSDYTISDYRQGSDGKLQFWMFSKDEEDKLMYMRKILAGGLFDPEAFSNTDTMANEKLATGKLAVFAAQDMVGQLDKTLYKTNPEMQYELLGPLKNKSGKIATQVEKPGRSGFPVIFLSAKIKNPDAALRFLDYINSDEGRLLAYWGIEGKDYQMENGKPKWIPDVKQKYDNDPDSKRDAGLNYLNANFIGGFSSDVTWPKSEDEKTKAEKLQASFSAKMPIQVIDKVSANYLAWSWPKWKQYQDATVSLNYADEFKKALFAKSDDQALKILHDIQDKYRAAGAEEMTDYVAQEAAKRDDIGF
ncbi:ABC transporter substrate-binding protein [Cohnella zeiphila]|uniref:ABC transporter substrate-binding protein n=1 Tax=Cohnella zeiphila TaxID=2761120 RepID=A0A7X0SLS1_9BACL|nr:ABC transporter substrate-binding protein [Cohnella zeiphila]MBB6732350.1 ABC transporter substrate-binding protein [Cohnella zeiphila]